MIQILYGASIMIAAYRFIAFLVIPLVLCGVLACGSDDTPTAPEPGPVTFKDLSERWHVLHNLEASYNQRNHSRYDELIDADFIFFFSQKT